MTYDEAAILVVDDEAEVHEDFRRCLAPAERSHPNLDALRQSLFGVGPAVPEAPRVFPLAFAKTGREAVDLVARRLHDNRPIALAFVDMRLVSEWNGVQTICAMLKVDPRLQVVLCTAYSDFSWDRVLKEVGGNASLHLLRKPFEPERVRRYANALCKKWQLARRADARSRGGP